MPQITEDHLKLSAVDFCRHLFGVKANINKELGAKVRRGLKNDAVLVREAALALSVGNPMLTPRKAMAHLRKVMMRRGKTTHYGDSINAIGEVIEAYEAKARAQFRPTANLTF